MSLDTVAGTGTITALRVPRLVSGAARALAFRRCLHALAEPGLVGDLAGAFGAAPGTPPGDPGLPVAAAPLLVLSDLLCPVAAMPADPEAADEVAAVAALTHAPIVPHRDARLVLALREPARADLMELPRGTAWAPHTAALLCLAVGRLGEGPRLLRLRGPGIDGSRDLPVAGLGDEALAARADALAYPLGFDILLIDAAGRVAGLPRTTTIEVLS